MKKTLAQIRLVVFEKNAKNRSTPTNSNFEKNDVTEPKARLL